MKSNFEKLLTKMRINSLPNFFEKYSIYLILILALILRYRGINYGLPYIYRDEGSFVNPSIKMLVTGDLNPHWFGHPGSFVMYLLLLLFSIYFIFYFIFGYVHNLSDFQQLFSNDPSLFYLGGRLLMILFALLTIYLVYLITNNLFNRAVSILASFLLAISPLHTEYSRFIRTDIAATVLVMFSIYFLLRFVDSQNKNTKLLILSSLFAGFSIATKYTAGIIIFPILIHCLIVDSKQKRSLKYEKKIINLFNLKNIFNIAAIFIFTGFLIFAPFVLLDPFQAIKDIIVENRGAHMGQEKLPGIQNYLWYLTFSLRGGIGGLFFEMFAGLGLLLIIYKKSYEKYLFLIFSILYFLIVGSMNLRWEHWFIPILPFEAIFFGLGYYYSYKYIIQRKIFQNTRLKIFLPKTRIICSVFVVIIILGSLPPIINDINEGTKLSRLDTRTAAKIWIENNLPDGSIIEYDVAGPQLKKWPRNNFTTTDWGWYRGGLKPLSYYKNQSVDYIIITNAYIYKDMYYKEPGKYAKEISNYNELLNGAELIKVFDNKDNPGPIIEIYGFSSIW